MYGLKWRSSNPGLVAWSQWTGNKVVKYLFLGLHAKQCDENNGEDEAL